MRPVPAVAGLSQENLPYWIWKLLKQSGRPHCLIFMPILRLLSSGSARPGMDGVSGIKRKPFACNLHPAVLEILAKGAIFIDNGH